MSFKIQIKKIRSFSETQVDVYTLICRNLCLLNEGGTNKDVIKRFDNSYGAHGFNAIIYQLASSIVKDCFELLFSQDKKSPSTHNLIHSLNNKKVYNHFQELFAKPLKTHWIGKTPKNINQRIIEERRAERLEIFDTTYAKFVASYDDLKKSDLYKKIKNVRNKVVSHFEVKMIDDIHKQTTVELFDFKWKDIDAIVEATKPIVFDGYLLTNNASYDLEGLQTQAELVAKDFWGR